MTAVSSVSSNLYYIVPLLVEQPTWGGTYISHFKGLTDPSLVSQNIGQAFELAQDSLLMPAEETESVSQNQPAYGLATATDLAHAQWFNTHDRAVPLQSVIDSDPEGILGSRALAQLGAEMKILIKFTQAKNNSYQVHVKPGQEFGQWLAKPESWYYFEPGQATLGLAPGVDVAEYQQRCQEIETFAGAISQKITAGKLTVADGRQQLAAFINQDHPRRFVNTVSIEADQIIDLSRGGVHHSWEVNPEQPQGNILYEVQVDVRDQFCTLRSFDQGSIKDDGQVRPLTINDYFAALDTDPERKRPATYMSSAVPGQTERKLFDNPHYQTSQLQVTGEYSGPWTTLTNSFQHLFVQSGCVVITVDGHRYLLNQGWSVLIPASTGQYHLTAEPQAQVLITTA